MKSAVALLATDGGGTHRPPLVRHQDALSLNQVFDMHTNKKHHKNLQLFQKIERAIFRDGLCDIVCGLFDCANATVLASYYITVALQYHLNFPLNCSSQPSMVQWLSSPIFPFCRLVVCPAMVTSPLLLAPDPQTHTFV